MFGTTLAGVLLGMAINRGTFLRIIVLLLVGAACFYFIPPEYTHTYDIKEITPNIIIVGDAYLFYGVCCLSLPLIFISCREFELYEPFTLLITYALPYVYCISSDYGIWPPIAGAYWGTVLGETWAYFRPRTF